MYMIDDICYADEMTENIKVKTATVLEGGLILVEFSTQEKRLFDPTCLTGSAFLPLREKNILSDITIFHGVMTWMDGEIDIAPETVYGKSYPYNESETVTACVDRAV
jgi:hypothetical protein